MRFRLFLLAVLFATTVFAASMQIGTFLQEERTFYSTKEGLPSNSILSLAVTAQGDVYAGTDTGLAVFRSGKWTPVKELSGQAIGALAANKNTVIAFSQPSSQKGGTVYVLDFDGVRKSFELPSWLNITPEPGLLFLDDRAFIGGSDDLYQFSITGRKIKPHALKMPHAKINQIAAGKDGILWVATSNSLLKFDPKEKMWQRVYPADHLQSWAPLNVHGAVFDKDGHFWFAAAQGVGAFDGTWSLYTGHEGLPYNDFTIAAAGGDGAVWFGTHKGAIRYDGKTWEYRQGLRWLPDDDVRDIAVDADGNAWFATKNGVGVIRRVPMTLAKKAKWYEDEIDRYHRRTPYQYVLEVGLSAPGDKTKVIRHDSDNDGLWTSMYGAGECFAYAATKSAKAKQRAGQAFEALRFLRLVTQGGSNPAPPGFVARTILPTSGPNPNDGRVERDKWGREHNDRLWKVIDPRWPVSADGKWYWKSDTSSDELDGHYFFYGLYYDLVAETEAEKTRVREQVRALTDHLIEHDFQLVDHDGKPTRWARYDPKELNHDKNWAFDRGLNSLSILSYLATAEHITGDQKYAQAKIDLIDNHGYLQNMMCPKFQRGEGTGNQSDDEMAFMCFYNFIKYEKDAEIKSRIAISFSNYWRLEKNEMNPFFNFAFAASCTGLNYTDAFGTYSTDPTKGWLVDAMETLKRFPLDRVNWRHENHRRIDIINFEDWRRGFDEDGRQSRGKRVNGKVIPIDESYCNHWNRDPWELDSGGNGRELGDGAVFLLPYYMGLYHGFIVEK